MKARKKINFCCGCGISINARRGIIGIIMMTLMSTLVGVFVHDLDECMMFWRCTGVGSMCVDGMNQHK